MADDFDLEQFVSAQAHDYEQALAEIRRGRKTSHWIWYVFPQIAGLGMSGMSQRYAISGLAEARAYLAHPVLGPRLIEASDAVAQSEVGSAEQLLGGIDAIKVRSSMTLFARVDPDEPVFAAVLKKYYAGPDQATLDRL